MVGDFLVPFIAIALAEIGDKTQLAMMVLAARYRRILQIFAGAILASVAVDGTSVLVGSYVAKYLPPPAMAAVSGTLFVALGFYMLLKGEKGEKEPMFKARRSLFFAAFALFFVSEFGDKSQVAALLLGANYNVILAFLGVVSGIAVVLAAMLLLGKYLGQRLNQKAIRMASGAVFIAIGVVTLSQLFWG